MAASPVCIPSSRSEAAVTGLIPAEVIIGIAIEPIIITAPSPFIPRNINATAAVSAAAMGRGLSPASSAAFFIMALEMPVFIITLANIAPNTTTAIELAILTDPPETTTLIKSVKGIPAARHIAQAIKGKASIVGSFLAIISPANIKNISSINNPWPVIICHQPFPHRPPR